MTSLQTHVIPLTKQAYHDQISRLLQPTYRRLLRILSTYLFFNIAFLAIGIALIIVFLSLSSFLGAMQLAAYVFAAFIFTIFCYLILRLYIQAKKPEHLIEVCESYLQKCKEFIDYQEGIPEHHIALANAAFRFASNLGEKEYTLFRPPSFLKTFAPFFENFCARFFWEDFHRMKEYLLEVAVDQHIKVVKCEPTHLEVHAALANAYVRLSALYAPPKKQEVAEDEKWIPKQRHSSQMKEKFIKTAERAIEEFKILSAYAPHDPWIHIQLAYSYHDLQMPLEEIREYEIVLSLRPHDPDTLFKLGVLYFEQGMTAQGLRIYDSLRKIHPQKCENLIKFYDMID
jgi:tetratricopeptide (TPR) repeat protein